MNTIIKHLGLLAIVAAFTIFSGNVLADRDSKVHDTYEDAVERGWSYDDEIQNQLDADKG